MRHHQDKLLLFLTIAVALATFLPPGSVGFTAGGGKNIPGRKRGILQVRQTEKKILVNNKAKTLRRRERELDRDFLWVKTYLVIVEV